MNDLLNAIFGLGIGGNDASLGFGEPGVVLDWTRPLPAWAWLLVAAAVGALAWFGYRRLAAPLVARTSLATARALTLLLVAVLVSAPALVRSNERTERDHVALLVDRSRSLMIPDAGDVAAGLSTRDEQLRTLLDESSAVFTGLAEDKDLLWLGFDRAAYELAASETAGDAPIAMPVLPDAAGDATDPGRAIDAAIDRLAARPVSGIVLFTDGRSPGPVPRETVQELVRLGVPVFPVPLGSPEPARDLAIARVDAPEAAFVGDAVPIRVTLDTRGDQTADRTTAQPPRVTITDAETGRVLTERAVTPDELEAGAASLTIRPTEADLPTPDGSIDGGIDSDAATVSDRRLRVTITPPAGDLLPDNNTAERTITLARGPIRVLYIDGSPRWEHRYLKNILLREPSIDAAVLLYAVGRRYEQDGDIVLPRLPETAEDWAEFDVVIIGDTRAELFSASQLEGLRNHVAARGGGVLWLGGPAQMPGGWHDTPAGVLLPITPPIADPRSSAAPGRRQPLLWDESVTLVRTDASRELGVIELGNPDAAPDSQPVDVADPAAGWTLLRWAQRIGPERLKPAAQPLALATPTSGNAPPTPLVTTMRFGAGRSVYVATDEIWRWRFGQGENLTERFWIPIVRLLARGGLTRAGQAARLTGAPRESTPGDPVLISLELLDQRLIDARPGRVAATVERIDDDNDRAADPFDAGSRPDSLVLSPDSSAGVDDDAERAAGITYSTAWTTDRPGRYRVSVSDPLLAGLGESGLSVTVTVASPRDELRVLDTDHPALERLAEATGGRVLLPSVAGEGGLASLPQLLPNRERVVETAPDVRTLWDTMPALAALVLLLTIEWVGRRLVRLA